MKKSILYILLSFAALSSYSQGVKPDMKFAEQFINSEMNRAPEAWQLEGAAKAKWTYTIGLELKAMVEVAESGKTGLDKNKIYDYAETYTNALIDEKGNITGYKMDAFKLDDINSGKLLYHLYDKTGKQQYKNVIDTLYKQLTLQPRVVEGGYWHKKIYTEQMWLDGLYMAEPFKAEYIKRYFKDNPTEQANALKDIVHQFTLVYDKTLCPKCHLPHHGWDSVHKQSWCDPETGRSAHAWGRAIGWYLMAIVDTYDIVKDLDVPNKQTEIDSLSAILNSIGKELLKLQDKKNGCWQQVLDMTGEKGNYFEMSVTPMVAYSFLKGYHLGLLPKAFKTSAEKALNGICKDFVKVDKESGLVRLTQICSVAGLSADRDGSYEYYLREPVRDNDPKGVGPLWLAILEK